MRVVTLQLYDEGIRLALKGLVSINWFYGHYATQNNNNNNNNVVLSLQ
jgi:hypothetical protein